MSRFGFAIALLVAVYAALITGPLLLKASEDLRCHAVGSNPGDFERVHTKGA